MRNLPRRISAVLAAALFCGLQQPAALAEETGGNPGAKLTRGLVNIGTGWLEIPAQISEQKKTDHTAILWMVHGLFNGVAMGLGRTLYGVWDTLTFPVAPYDAPIMNPDTLIRPKQNSL